ncbi:MAG: DUF2147 domain-containing protein [Cyclobacteriaceae bacterium]|nr:DUF2147 domain-containing protein [Cyclobacteriaceae bacterium]
MNIGALISPFALWLFISVPVKAQDVLGQWSTVDDQTREVKSVVEIYTKKGQVFGKVVAISDPQQQEATCSECDDKDPRKNQPIIGMEIIKGLKKVENAWTNGEILDPENGKVYKCKIWVENGSLVVRGYLGFTWLGRSQTWAKASN